MFLVGIISWWYGPGWKGRLVYFRQHLQATASFFSIGQLFSTLFSPFRQISAGRSSGSFSQVLRGMADQLISRVIGAIVRFFTIIFGVIALILQSLYEGVILAFWLILPVFPIVGLILFAIGWTPAWI